MHRRNFQCLKLSQKKDPLSLRMHFWVLTKADWFLLLRNRINVELFGIIYWKLSYLRGKAHDLIHCYRPLSMTYDPCSYFQESVPDLVGLQSRQMGFTISVLCHVEAKSELCKPVSYSESRFNETEKGSVVHYFLALLCTSSVLQ